MEQQPLTRHEDAVSAAGDVVVGGVRVGRRQPRHGPRQRGGRPTARLVRQVLADPRPRCERCGLPGEYGTCALHSLLAGHLLSLPHISVRTASLHKEAHV